MALSDQIPAPKEPQKADCPSASCSRILVSITRVELLALVKINLKARDGNRAIGNDAEALRLEHRAKELLELSESDSENVELRRASSTPTQP